MGWIVWMVIVTLVSLGIATLDYLFGESRSGVLAGVARYARKTALLVFLVVGGLSTLFASVYQIEAGHVGVVYSFGAIVDQVEEGLKFVAPWRSVSRANTQIQSHAFTGKYRLSSFSFESQDVFVEATLNIMVSPKTVQELYRTVGPHYFEKLVAPRMDQNFKDETVKYKSVDIAPNREQIRHTVTERLKRELSPYSIEVTDLLLNNVDFRPEFKKAIEDKQIATQSALEEEQKVAVERHKASQAVERAKGVGQSELEKAKKIAEANKLLIASITSDLIQYNLVNKLGDKIEVIIMPAGQNFILSPEMLKKSKTKTQEKSE